MHARSNNWGQKVVSAVVSASLIATMVGIVPSALTTEEAYAAADTTGYVTCSAYRAAEPTPEILGLTGVSTNGQWSSGLGVCEWNAPYFYLMGTSEFNSNPNPYIVNAIANASSGGDDAQPTLTMDSRKGGPTAAMYEYGADANNTAVWDQLPDVILGTNNGQVNYTTSGYADKAAEATGISDYNPIGVTYTMTNSYTMIDSMYELAAAGDYVVANSNGTKKLRYGNATEIAEQYEAYVRGTQGYILKQLAANNAEKKTVVLINDYDSATDTFTAVETGVAEGTATANRYLETTQNVATNIADTLGTTLTREQISSVDLIMLGSQSGGENVTTTNDLIDALGTTNAKKTFWVDSDNTAAGALYGTVMNSVENAQNYGRILGCLYDEYIDQDDWICYYYDNFYHLNNNKLAEAIDYAMDYVRNWDSDGDMTSWTEADAATYKESDVQAILDEGMEYLAANASSVASYLVPSDTYTASHTESTSTSVNYTDLVNDGWSTDAIYEMAEKGLMTGHAGTTNFGYGETMTRAQFATVLWRFANTGVSSLYTSEIQASTRNTTTFSDVVTGEYYTAAANWTVSNEIMGQNVESFNVNGEITLAEIATIIARYVDGDKDAKETDTSILTSGKYTDGAEAAADWSAAYLAWGIQKGLFTGSDNHDGTYTLDFGKSINRERVAKMLSNALANNLLD